jgi:hypothetical protein
MLQREAGATTILTWHLERLNAPWVAGGAR